MVKLYGEELSRREIAARSGNLSQFAGVRSMTLADGLERGIRLLEFRTGTGLRFTVLVDRALDIADCEFQGKSIGWHSPSGFRHPGLHEYEGEGGLAWLRSFSGLMVTCGLDHILFMHEEAADHYNYSPRATIKHSIHGRVGTIPAKLHGYGETWSGDKCTLWCEGSVVQGTVFGEHLELIRRIEADVGSNEIRIRDRVINKGFYRTPHMYCYHINLGSPLLAEGSRLLAPIEDVVWAAHSGESYRTQSVGYREFPGPQDRFHEQVWQHELAAEQDGKVPVAVINDELDFGFGIVTRKNQFPCMYEWQNFQSGQYALGVEPSTNHVLGHAHASAQGELIWLEHADEREYETEFVVLGERNEIDEFTARVESTQLQPRMDYPETSGNHRSLKGQT